jgi:hypothetical protein
MEHCYTTGHSRCILASLLSPATMFSSRPSYHPSSLFHTTPVALLQSRVLTPFIDSPSIDDKSCSLVLTRIVQYRYSGSRPASRSLPRLHRLHPRNSTNLSICSSRTIVSSLSRLLVIHFTRPYRTTPITSPSPRRIAQEGSGTIQQHAPVIQLSSLRLSSRNSVL